MRHALAGFTLAALLLACSAPSQSPATKSAKSLLDAYVSAWNRHDFAAVDSLLSPDAVHEDIAANFAGKGPAQVKEFMRAVIGNEPDLEWRITSTIEEGPRLAAEWTWRSTYSGDTPNGPVKGYRISGRGESMMETENGKIKRFADYYDLASFFRKAARDSTGK